MLAALVSRRISKKDRLSVAKTSDENRLFQSFLQGAEAEQGAVLAGGGNRDR